MNLLSLISKSKFFMSLPGYARLLFRLYRDARVPLGLKLGGAAAALLIVSPLDPFADIPFLNVLDDTALLMLAARIFMMLCPSAVVAEHKADIGFGPSGRALKNVTDT